ncbi:alpha/beta hydrolase-fold protein [Actinomycetaceae bacterium MB13-C1-2]|nr:alpha/beta hydrolase-fold protein [Actinomycetaceae bacterium MB13-C1-2]
MTTQIWTNVRSESLEMQTTLTVVTPEGDTSNPVAWPEVEPGLLVLLHGLTGNSAQWPVRADLQPVADRFNLVIATPEGQRSFWINQEYGLRYGDWVGVELPDLIRRTLRISASRDDTLVGGLSMGGYGAFRAAFDHPDVYSAAFSLSGCLDVADEEWRERHQELYLAGFGSPEYPRPEDDLIARLQEMSVVRDAGQPRSTRVEQTNNNQRQHPDNGGTAQTGTEPIPPSVSSDGADESTPASATQGQSRMKLFASCGTEDALLDQSRLFAEAAGAAGVELEYQEGAGDHNFEFWSHWLPIALDHLITR